MLQTEYIKDMHSSYMVIKGDRDKNKNYTLKMLLGNSIPGLIRTELRTYDNIDVFYYDITGRKELIKTYETSSLSYQDLTTILGKVINIIEGSLDYLLCEDDFIINPNYIFLDREKRELLLCYLVGYQVNLREQFSEFVEYLMNKVDYKDEAAVLLVYSIYKQSKESDCSFLKLKEELLQKHNDKVNEIKNNLKLSSENCFKNGNDSIADTKKGKEGSAPPNSSSGKATSNNSNTKAKETIVNGNNTDSKKLKKSTYVKQKNTTYTPLKNEIEEEVEVYYYPPKIYVLIYSSIAIGISMFLLGFFFHFYDNELHTGVDMVKVICTLIILFCLEYYVIIRLLNNKNKITKMVSLTHYQEEDEEMHYVESNTKNNYRKNRVNTSLMNTEENLTMNLENDKQEPTEVLWVEDIKGEDTQVLEVLKPIYFLKPLDKENYKYISISEFPFLIGKEKDKVNAVIHEKSVSRTHCKLEEDEGVIYLRDLGSTNGTFINGKRLKKLESYRLENMDEVLISNVKYRYEIN